MPGQLRRLAAKSLRVVAKTGFATADLFQRDYPGPRVLIYHQIGSGLGRQMEVSEASFRAHIFWLIQNTTVVDLATAIERRGDEGANRLVALTFDDGYDDFYRLGFPLLLAHNLPFVLYLTTEAVETGSSLGPPQAKPLNWDQVERMASSGLMTMGGHTHRHRDLRFLSRAQVSEEMATSDELIERRIGQPPRHFAYPYGYWSSEADAEVRQRYDSAALGGGPPVTAATDPFMVHRLPIQLSDGVFFFRRKVQTGFRLEESIRRRLNRYQGP